MDDEKIQQLQDLFRRSQDIGSGDYDEDDIGNDICRILRRANKNQDTIPQGIIESLISGMKHPNPGIRRNIARAMTYVETTERNAALFEALSDEEYGVRSTAAEGLGILAFDTMVGWLDGGDLEQRQIAVSTLGHIGEVEDDARIIEPLSKSLEDENSGVRWSAVHHLLGMMTGSSWGVGPDSGLQILDNIISICANADAEMLEECYNQLSDVNLNRKSTLWGDETDLSMPDEIESKLRAHMIDCLDHEDNTVRRYCLAFMGRNQIRETEDKIIDMLSTESDRHIKCNAIQVLGIFKSIKCESQFLGNLDDTIEFEHGVGMRAEPTTLQMVSFNALCKLGFDSYLDKLIEVYEGMYEDEKRRVMGSLAIYKNKEVSELFREEIYRNDTELRGNRWQDFIEGKTSLMELAINALCNSGQIEHMSMILDLVEEHDELRIRRHCIECLIGGPVTEMFGNWNGMYIREEDREKQQIVYRFLQMMLNYVLAPIEGDTSQISNQDRISFSAGFGWAETLQGKVFQRINDTYYAGWLHSLDDEGNDKPIVDMHEIVVRWKESIDEGIYSKPDEEE